MEKETDGRKDPYRRTVAFGLAVLIIVLAFLIVRPFLVAIFSAGALAYIFYPFYKLLNRKYIKSDSASAMITCAIIILVVLIPMVFLTSILTYEIRHGYLYLREYLQSPEMFKLQVPPVLNQILGSQEQTKALVLDMTGQLLSWLQDVLKGIPNVILSIFVTVFSAYYLLKNGKDLYNFLIGVFPIPEKRYEQMLKRFDDLSRSMIVGQIMVGVVQGVLAWAGFYFLGVSNPVLLGFLTIIISVIPLLGAALVWVPVDIYLFASAYFTGINWWKAIALLVYGTFVISLIDNILKPKIVGERAKIHPLIILFGILGGIQLFGIPGILIGPLILTLFDIVIETYRETL